MESREPTWTLAQLAAAFGGELVGSPERVIRRPSPAGTADPQGLTFADNPEYLRLASSVEVGAILAVPGCVSEKHALILVENPRETFFKFLMMCDRPMPITPGIHSTAVVHAEAKVDATASIGPYAVVERGASIGANAQVFAFCYVGDNCSIGAKAILYPNVVLYRDVAVGDRTILHSGVVLGADGFGFVWDGKRRIKIPQVGRVEIGADVELGANTAVDRSTAGATTIGRGTKIDNLVQIGHNCAVGEDCAIASMTGISGSTTIGNRVIMAGQVATNDHVKIGDDIILGGRSGVMRDIVKPGAYYGLPALPLTEGMRILAVTQKLPDMHDRLKQLEKRVAELESKQ